MKLWDDLLSAFFDRNAKTGSGRTGSADSGRSTVRKPQRMKEGYLWSDGMITPRPCTIRDMSALGAQIALWNDDLKASLLRGPVKLYSCADRMEVDCTVARRDGNVLGLRFTSGFHGPTKKYV